MKRYRIGLAGRFVFVAEAPFLVFGCRDGNLEVFFYPKVVKLERWHPCALNFVTWHPGHRAMIEAFHALWFVTGMQPTCKNMVYMGIYCCLYHICIPNTYLI